VCHEYLLGIVGDGDTTIPWGYSVCLSIVAFAVKVKLFCWG
jgi:hypothetical protein